MSAERGLPREQLVAFLGEMLLIRRFEEKVTERFRAGELAGFLVYRSKKGLLALIHTVVEDRFERRGLGGRLARFALDQARADFAFCFRYTQTGPGIVYPYFHPWNGPGAGKAASYDGGSYGLVGSIIGAMIAGGIERSKRQMNMMHCMIPRGYQRYRISEPLWKELNGGDRLGSIEVGKIANLIVTDGDPLEITTQIRHLIINGQETDMRNRHLDLYEKYRSRPARTATE